jgi:hypothetical protein
MVTFSSHRFHQPTLLLLLFSSALALTSCDSMSGHTTLPLDPSAPRTKVEPRPDVGPNKPKDDQDASVDDNQVALESLALSDETPRQLVCKRKQGSSLVGDMSVLTAKGSKSIASFTLNGNVGACEMARRAARNGIVCIESGSSYQAIQLTDRRSVKAFGGDLKSCLAYTQKLPAEIAGSDDFHFIDAKERQAYLKNLPKIADQQINAAMHSNESIWYDEDSMVFVYQDSFGNPTGPEGLRANRVAYDVGSTASVPDIRALTEYFELQTFKYPFSITAGRMDRGNSEAVYFWQPPKDESGNRLPVVWWKSGSHWNWVFPVGTVIGEVLLVRDESAPASEWYVYEIRSRVREIDGWRTDVFRPFTRAIDYADAIKKARKDWQSTDLKQLVAHLEDGTTLTPGKLDSKSYEKAVPSLQGFYDYLPATKDAALIKSLLRKTVFKSAMNTEWKRSGDKVTYAPATSASFQIVPKKHIAGLFENNEASCARCHDQTGRPLGQLDKRATLYGEIWGEDHIFTWHPFEPVVDMYSVSDGSRIPSKRLVRAGLLVQKKPASGDNIYRELPRGYVPNFNQ